MITKEYPSASKANEVDPVARFETILLAGNKCLTNVSNRLFKLQQVIEEAVKKLPVASFNQFRTVLAWKFEQKSDLWTRLKSSGVAVLFSCFALSSSARSFRVSALKHPPSILKCRKS